MGLSNEERYLKAVNLLTGMLEKLDTREFTTWNTEYANAYVEDVRESARQLLGMVIQQLDTNSAYWILGENTGGFRALTCEFFCASNGEDYFQLLTDEERQPAGEDMSLERFGSTLGFFRHRSLKHLAEWWDIWSYIPAMLYAVNRYKDDCFSVEFKQEFNRLTSKVLLLRSKLSGYTDVSQEEKVLLLKYQLFTDDHDTPVSDRIEKLTNMTQEELEEALKDKDRKRWAREDKADTKEPISTDPVYGKGVLSAEEKIRVLCDEFGCKRKIAIQALWHSFNHDLDEAREYLPELIKEDLKKNPKICKHFDCKKVLDPRNKSGYCREHLVKTRKIARRVKKK